MPHSGLALEARGIDVSGYVFLRSIKAVGQVQFLNAQIGRNLECNGGTIVNPIQKDLPGSGVAFLADDLTVKGSLFFSDGFKANGEVRLLDAHVGGTFGCEGGSFTSPSREDLPGSGRALSADRIHVGGSVFLGRGVTAIGEVRLPRAEIDGQLACNDGNFQRATVDITDVSACTLYDDRARWPAEGKLLLDGFTYGRINAPRGIDVSQRLAWLALQPSNPFPPRPYLQLAKVLRESGDDNGAQRVLIEMEHRRWKNSTWGPVVEWTIGYGFDPPPRVLVGRRAEHGRVGPISARISIQWNGPQRKRCLCRVLRGEASAASLPCLLAARVFRREFTPAGEIGPGR